MFLLPIHIAAGLLSIAAGAVALWAAKGSRLHRKGGWVFAVAMMTMTLSAVIMAGFIHVNVNNAIGGTLTFYLVCTGLLAVTRTVEQSRGLHTALLCLGLAASAFAIGLGLRHLALPGMKWMAIPLFLFGTIGLLGAYGDARVLIAGSIQGPRRLSRHLWRMTLAMWIATASFFLGQAKFMPEPLSSAFGLRSIPPVVVLVMMFYWLARLRRQQCALAAFVRQNGQKRGISHIDSAQKIAMSGMPHFMKSVKR